MANIIVPLTILLSAKAYPIQLSMFHFGSEIFETHSQPIIINFEINKVSSTQNQHVAQLCSLTLSFPASTFNLHLPQALITMKAAAAGAALHSSLCHIIPNSIQSKSTSPLTPKPQSLLQKHPLYSSTHTNLSLQFKEKVLCLEIMGLDSGKALSQNPSLLTASLHSIHSIISFLQSKGIQYKDMPRILGMCPKILTCSISSDLIPVFNFLAQDLKVPEQNFRGVINKCPRLLISCVKDQLKPALLYLRRLGFKDLEALAYQDPILLVSGVENTLIPKLNYLTEQGGFSRSDAVRMVLRCPALFTFSVENNFKPKLEYFENVMKGDKSELREFPQYFAFSLEKRIKPRYEQIVKLGINKMPLSAMLKMTDEEFTYFLSKKIK